MRKIPTVFVRDTEDMRRVTRTVHPDCQWVLDGEGVPTRKYDGTCVMFDGQRWWARREVKAGKPAPHAFVAVEHDDVTGKTVGWEPAEQSAFRAFLLEAIEYPGGYREGTYELCGPKINRNPEDADRHLLIPHAMAALISGVPRDYDGLAAFMVDFRHEGIVWHHPDGRTSPATSSPMKARGTPGRSTSEEQVPHPPSVDTIQTGFPTEPRNTKPLPAQAGGQHPGDTNPDRPNRTAMPTEIVPGLTLTDDLYQAAETGIATYARDLAPLTWERFTEPRLWTLVPDLTGDCYKAEFVLRSTIERTIKINRWFLPDLRGNATSTPHSHPWPFTARILNGRYREDRYLRKPGGAIPDLNRDHPAGTANVVPLSVYHEVTEVDDNTLTLMVCARGERGRWGYLDVHTGEHRAAEFDPDFAAKLAALNPHHR